MRRPVPYSGPADPSLPDNVKGMPEGKRRQWVAVFNSVYERCRADGGDEKECEGRAFPQANGVVKMAELKTESVADIAVLRTGKGFMGKGCPEEGCEFTEEMLDQVVDAYWATRLALQAPVKLGHDDEQQLLQSDGYPAAGWVANLRRRGDRLYADLVSVPARVADLIRAGAYRNVSVELDPNQEIEGKTYPWMLTGLALLGADLPAVDGLGGITKLYQSLKLELKADTHTMLMETEQEETLDTFLDRFDALITTAERHFKGKVGAPVLRSLQRAFKEGLRRAASGRRMAEWDTAYINELPDSAFAYVASGGEKDAEGKTVPRSLRYLPHHNAQGGIDLPHLRNALARAPQTSLPAEAKAQAIRHLQGHARSEGVGEQNQSMAIVGGIRNGH